MPVRREAFAGKQLNLFYSLQALSRTQNGLVTVGEWGVAKGPDGDAVASAPPAARVAVNVPANTSLAVLSAWSTRMDVHLSLQLAPAPLWSTSGLTSMSLYANASGIVQWHVALDPAERYRLRITLPSFEEKDSSVMLRDMTFYGAE